MSVIAELNVPADQFKLGKVLKSHPEAHIEIERVVPLSESLIPLFWVYGVARAQVVSIIREDMSVKNLRVLDDLDKGTLYRIEWAEDVDGLLQVIVSVGAVLLKAEGANDRWHLELRFASHEDLQNFQRQCIEREIQIDARRIYNPTKPDASPWYGLTAEQRQTLLLAHRKGYFDIPRGVSMLDLADGLDVSDQAVSERIRRGITTLISNTLLSESE